jgi:hypothetical protein
MSQFSLSRPRRVPEWFPEHMRLPAAALVAGLLTVATACSGGHATASHSPSAASSPTSQTMPTVWICRPGGPSAACTDNLDATVVGPVGAPTKAAILPAATPPADCFYIYPTVSQAPTDNAPLESTPAIEATVHAQAALFSSVCRVFAPVYRQLTAGSLISSRYDDPVLQNIAYGDVRSAWRDYLEHDNAGRPFVLIGHSQGATMLTRLVHDEFDSDPATQKQLLSAILLGGNITVRDDNLPGGTFRNVPACSKPGATKCVIAYSSFATTPPSTAFFGRTTAGGQHVLCTDPTALAGARGPAHPYVPAARVSTAPKPLPGTGFVAYPGGIRVACRTASGATWLQVTRVPGSRVPQFDVQLGPDWGLHSADVTLALGDLVEAVRRQEAG